MKRARAGADEQETCAVCLEKLCDEDDSGPATALPCGHRLHKECLLLWRGHKGDACPVCRAPVLLGALVAAGLPETEQVEEALAWGELMKRLRFAAERCVPHFADADTLLLRNILKGVLGLLLKTPITAGIDFEVHGVMHDGDAPFTGTLGIGFTDALVSTDCADAQKALAVYLGDVLRCWDEAEESGTDPLVRFAERDCSRHAATSNWQTHTHLELLGSALRTEIAPRYVIEWLNRLRSWSEHLQLHVFRDQLRMVTAYDLVFPPQKPALQEVSGVRYRLTAIRRETMELLQKEPAMDVLVVEDIAKVLVRPPSERASIFVARPRRWSEDCETLALAEKRTDAAAEFVRDCLVMLSGPALEEKC